MFKATMVIDSDSQELTASASEVIQSAKDFAAKHDIELTDEDFGTEDSDQDNCFNLKGLYLTLEDLD